MFQLFKSYFSPVMGQRFQEFDGLRAWAILMVFGVHWLGPYAAVQYYGGPTHMLGLSFLRFLNAGHIGVDLFFVLSGFLIFYVLTSQPVGLAKFIQKRFQRLLPAHWFVVFLLLVVFHQNFSELSWNTIFHVLLNLFFLNQFIAGVPALSFVSWSLSYEFVFYIFLWFCVTAFNKNKTWDRLWAWILVLLFLYSLQIMLPKYFGNPYKYLDMARGAAFFWGVFLGRLYFYEKTLWDYCQKYCVKYSVLAMVGIVLLQVFWSMPGHAQRLIEHRGNLMAYYLILHALMTVLVGAMLSSQPQFLKKVFSFWPLRMLGLTSYSFYLVHGVLAIPISAYFLKWMSGSFLKILVHGLLALVLSFFLSILSYHFWERPYFLRKKQAQKK